MSANEDTFHLGVKAIIRNAGGQILLLKVNVAELTGVSQAYWDIPGGRKQRGESIEQTLRREVEEEIGIATISDIRPLATVLSDMRIPVKPRDVGLVLAVLTCKIDPRLSIRLSKEHVAFDWFEPHEAARLLQVVYPASFTETLRRLA